MKFSEHWLRTHVNPSLEREDLAHQLTMAGLEVEALETVAPAFNGVVVGEVISAEKHPQADRLKLLKVNVGKPEPLDIVCGAGNVVVGMKAPCAMVGALLPGEFKIKLAKVRGIESYGMMCSEKELGLALESDGLLVLAPDAVPGEDIRLHLDLDDALFTLKLTPNRADCLSVAGVAREVAAITGSDLQAVEFTPVASQKMAASQPLIKAEEACGLYLNRLLVLNHAKVATPAWMERRLVRSGIRTHSIVVDVTNYVLLELGQPMHAFDVDKLKGGLEVRWAQAGEGMTLLNEQKVELKPSHLVIADETGPVALAGVMGGMDSAVSDTTTRILLESAFFSPAAIAGRAREFGLSSDSAHRFERGVDYGNTRVAMERATQLLLDLCGGVAGEIVEAQTTLPTRTQIRVRPARVERVLGIELSTDTMVNLLRRLGCQVEVKAQPGTGVNEAKGELLVTPPSWRFDLEIEADAIEEIARLNGYDNIPVGAPLARFAMSPVTEGRLAESDLKARLVQRGFQEVITYSFVDEKDEARLSAKPSTLKLMNPIASNLAVMRSSILPGLVSTLAFNTSRKQERIRIFEAGRCFYPGEAGQYQQPRRLAGLIYGSQLPEQWGVAAREVDYYDLKADVEALCQGKNIRFVQAAHPAFHPGRCAAVEIDGVVVGHLGEMHPGLLKDYDLPRAPCLFELELEPLLAAEIPHYQAVSRFQPVRRDLAVLVDKDTAVGEILNALNQALPTFVTEVALFDLYAGKGLPENKKSLAFRIVMQDTEKTLNDVELEKAVAEVLAVLTDRFGAQLR